ncbi:Stealth CR1 domain-containing protein [Pelagimonas varians]|uniref:Capsular polysaccharide phosphotransferase cps12A n=1 Tax=Pelagimonas varians TaxID=696760 RepID=A0A238JZ32_9RHOB|nr:Stealth CR1 domain-containing protein [Pelagimonas varians]PYG33010.1 Stealth-like protein [Pelagimonas varians]SMX35457.1 Capsular polysaccharide phosphotransferase cps12A [Pelagimonas varians]
MQRDVFETKKNPDELIDAVITWVDGSSRTHSQKRNKYMAQSPLPLHENAINPHRWVCSDEILFCLQSIENFAPWVRTIWIVVDIETPDLTCLSADLRAKIRFVDHTEIFDGFTQVLPTFNSLAIESMLWRIEGLSERFVYFNDDVFLAAPLEEVDVFDGGRPVLRGKWVDYSRALYGSDVRSDPAKFNHFMQLKAAQMMGFGADNLFASAHVIHPVRRSVMAGLFDHHRAAFLTNISHRFRDLSQFLPQGLHNHACIAAQNALIQTSKDHLHIYSGQGIGQPSDETRAVLTGATDAEIKFLCVNDLPQLEQVVPEARELIGQAIGGWSRGGTCEDPSG